MRLILFLFATISFLFSITACRSTKKIQRAIVKKDTVAVSGIPTHADTLLKINEILGNLNKSNISYRTFAAKIKVDYSNQKGKQPDFVANVRMRKDSLIWISLSNDIGIEGIRVLITKDSIKVLDKLANTYQRRPLASIQEISQIPFSFSDLQELLVGNPVFFNRDSINSYTQFANGFTLLSIGSLFRNLLSVNNAFQLDKSKLDDIDPKMNRTADLLYREYENKTGFLFSTIREISLTQQNKLDVYLKFKDYHFDTELNYPFTIPKKFKRID